jgi:pilus assembly protein CpaB
MRRRLIIVLAFASLIGLIASFLVYRVVVAVQANVKPDSTAEIVVAAANMGMAETITPKHVKVVSWPKASVPPGAITSLADAENRVVRSSIVAGEPLIEGKLAPQLAGRGGLMPMLVAEGQRAVTIKVDDATRETGFILPNSHVDILVSMARPNSPSGERIAKIVLQDVQVLASGQIVELRDNKPVTMTTVTLSLDPERTERLTLAQTEGRLFLVTRNMNDKKIVNTSGATRASLLADGGSARPTPPAVASAPKRRPVTVATAPPAPAPVLPTPTLETVSVSVLRGTQLSEHRFVRKGTDQWVEKTTEKER